MDIAHLTAENLSKRLAIIVPYRDRAEHVGTFISHMVTYFERDKLDHRIAYSINIIEQPAGKPFNRGKLLNCGFQIARDSHDYFCFHDVDYLPIWADYSYPACPTRIIWHGLRQKENYETFFGGVVLFGREDFIRANGYGNEYWGWGPEDMELGFRVDLTGMKRDRRDGTYRGLPHPDAGFNPDRTYKSEAQATIALWQDRKDRLNEIISRDGLTSLQLKILEQNVIPVDRIPIVPRGPITRYLVDI
jgi:N-terminal region of glycosyl transferase group 7/N-terminal domain of galactosyltransferase